MFLTDSMMRFRTGLFALAIMASAGAHAQDSRPNILLIVADDLGYADLGCYGSNIRTPSIDQLAKEGIRFTQFHTAPTCAPTRTMLLTGNNNHVAGMGSQGGAAKGSWEASQPGYEGYLSDRVVTLPQILRDAGYHTYTAGKWHLGKGPEHSPAKKGFERSFNLLQGASNHYNTVGIIGTDSISQYSADGKLADYPVGSYSTEFYTNKLMQFIREGKDGRPFFAYAAYTSPHWPLQAPAENDRYRDKFDIGYDSLRALNFERLKKAGIIPQTQSLPPRLASIKPWEMLSAEEKRVESRKMELYAAMVDNLDEHVGRLIQFLKNEKLYDNTVILFMSDNGAAAEDFYVRKPYADFIAPRYDNSYDNMGSPTSFVSYGPQWAKAGAAPFSHHKGYTTEGGIVAPLIITGKGIRDKNRIRYDYLTVMDLAPTILEWTGAKYPAKAGASIMPMLGESLVKFLNGEAKQAHDNDYAMGLELSGRAFYRKGKWKIVNLEPPYRESGFKLFDMETDPGESQDLSLRYPDVYNRLIGEWKKYCLEKGIYLQASK